MEQALEAIHLDSVDGFDIRAELYIDIDTQPDDFDCYDHDQAVAWRNDDWMFVGTVITASHAGVDLASASMWGSEYGEFNGKTVSPLDGAGTDDFAYGYGPDLIAEAVAEAKAKIAELVK